MPSRVAPSPEKSDEQAHLMLAIYDRITVTGPEIVGVRLTQAAYAHGLALALPQKVELTRPTGVGRALATYEIPIEGRDEWVAAARRRGVRQRASARATERELVVVAAVLRGDDGATRVDPRPASARA